jgi:hypothetical protein
MPDDDPTSTTTNHLYDNPALGSLDFLLAVMHSSEVPIEHRIAAADALLPYIAPKPQPSIRPFYTNGIPGDKDVIVTVRISEMPGLGASSEQAPRLASVTVAVDQDEGPSLINPCPIRTN